VTDISTLHEKIVIKSLIRNSGPPLCLVDSWHYHEKKVVGLEWGPLSLVSTTEELLDRKSSSSCVENENMAVGICHADHVASIRKGWQSLRRQAVVAWSV
jgi:hypothetical protein